MKKAIMCLAIALSCVEVAQAQIGGVLNKAKQKVLDKALNKSDSQKKDDSATEPVEENPVNEEVKAEAKPNEMGPTKINFPATGKMVSTTRITYGTDIDDDIKKLLNNKYIQEGIRIARKKGLQGTDYEVFKQVMQNKELQEEIEQQVKEKYAQSGSALDEAPVTNSPALLYDALVGKFSYTLNANFIRAELVGGELSGEASLAKMFSDMMGGVSIVDVNAKKMYAVANYLGMPAAIVEDISSLQSVIGVGDYYKKYLQQPNAKVQPLSSKTFKTYKVNAVQVEIPVQPTRDEHGEQKDDLLYLHKTLNGQWGDFVDKKYNPSYKIFIELYYSHDLDKVVPAVITRDKGVTNIDGFLVGLVLRDEKNHKVTYSIKELLTDQQIDEGQFMIPKEYEKMTQQGFDKKLEERLKK